MPFIRFPPSLGRQRRSRCGKPLRRPSPAGPENTQPAQPPLTRSQNAPYNVRFQKRRCGKRICFGVLASIFRSSTTVHVHTYSGSEASISPPVSSLRPLILRQTRTPDLTSVAGAALGEQLRPPVGV